MADICARFIGTELYFNDLAAARDFYNGVLGLKMSEEQPGHHARFDSGAGFICLERKGSETYPSQDKAVLFFSVSDINVAVAKLGEERIIQRGPTWAVLHDPEGHNVLLVQG